MGFENNGARYVLTDPLSLPNASGFLWNKQMMIHATCRGYASSQFMQPEPSKYVAGPMLEAKSFMQPEQPYYAHHPGRFFYVKNRQTKTLFSTPYEPARANYDSFAFIVDKNKLSWEVVTQGIKVVQSLTLATELSAELWQIEVTNLGSASQDLSIYPYFPVGYRSWLNQSASYNAELNAVVCSNITPYQKVEQYFENQNLQDLTFLLSDKVPDAWETRQQVFEGEGGLHDPSGMQADMLECGVANYQIPAAIMQFNLKLAASENQSINFAFGPAKSTAHIDTIKQTLFNEGKLDWERQSQRYSDYLEQGKGCVQISTPDKDFDHFVNHWLPRQVFYHGDVNRLSTDPQTRNYLQDNMGLSYLLPHKSVEAFANALSQQHVSGEMPDGVLLSSDAELKYINQVPHTDHCVWLPICLIAYLQETGDYAFLQRPLPYSDQLSPEPVYQHISKAMHWLLQSRDSRGLSLINQGDWCDPMNMVGYKGKGVSAWLTIASAYAFNVWSELCESVGNSTDADFWKTQGKMLNKLANKHFWCGNWYARGITDGGRLFGTEADKEGKIFLNPQSWAMLSGACDENHISSLLSHIDRELDTPYGMMMLAPSYTAMVEDVGRVTQKFPGTAENGSVYNHATAFYIFSLFEKGYSDKAYSLLRKMLPNDLDIVRRGQLPIFVPNYYRGAFHQFPQDAGRSSQLFNTGTVAWFYRSVIEQLCGLRGHMDGLSISPCIPDDWPEMNIIRNFRDAKFSVAISRNAAISEQQTWLNGELLVENCIRNIEPGVHYQVNVILPTQTIGSIS